MSVPQKACPHCCLMTPAWRNDCIHCGKRKDEMPTPVYQGYAHDAGIFLEEVIPASKLIQ